MTSTSTTTTSTTPSTPTSRTASTSASTPATSATQRLVTVPVAVGAALTTWALASAAAPLAVVSDGSTEPVGAASVIGASAAAALAGWGVLALLERLLRGRARGARTARATWLAGATLLLLASMVPVVAPGGTTTGTRLALAALHVVVLAVVAVGLLHPLVRRTARPSVVAP